MALCLLTVSTGSDQVAELHVVAPQHSVSKGPIVSTFLARYFHNSTGRVVQGTGIPDEDWDSGEP